MAQPTVLRISGSCEAVESKGARRSNGVMECCRQRSHTPTLHYSPTGAPRKKSGNHQREGRRVPVAHPIALWPVGCSQVCALSSFLFQVADLACGTILKKIVPPIKPSPEEGRKPAELNYRANDVKSFCGIGQLTQVGDNARRLTRKRNPGDLSHLISCSQATQLIDCRNACQKNGHFRRGAEVLLAPLHADLRLNLCLWHRFISVVCHTQPVLGGLPRLAACPNSVL